MDSDQYVLLVEDDLDINQAIQSLLEEENYKVVCVFDGKEALEYLNTSKNIPSLILLDLMMPHMNGYEFREAQLQNPKIAKIPTIVLSATDEYEKVGKLNFQGCLRKPLDLETLIAAVKKNFNSEVV